MSDDKTNTIELFKSANKCCGCGACFNVCEMDAIEMRTDVINGYFPYVNVETCIRCGRCIEVCPVQNIIPVKEYSQMGFAVNADDEMRRKSSSGGVFGCASEWIIDNGGIVYGVAWDENLKAKHVRIENKEGLDRLRYSKYVQSDTGDSFRQVACDLNDGREVLYTGTPCQIAGLKLFIQNEKIKDDNLYLIDLICGYTPSSQLWEKYLCERYLETKPEDYRFRDKVNGWSVISNIKKDNSYENTVDDYYLNAFLKNMLLPGCCQTCKFKEKKYADITIGDFWKVYQFVPDMADALGTSAVLVNTERGEQLFRAIRYLFKEVRAVCSDEIKNSGGGFRILFHSGVDNFRHAIRNGRTMKEAYSYGMNEKYDVGLVGEWCNHNYGSHFTYYALKKAIEKYGYSVVLIGPPVTWWKHSKNIFGDVRFREIPSIKEDVAYLSLNEYDYEYLNEKCSIFCVGSDTTFNEFQFFDKKKYAGLAWTDDDKGRIMYGGSFGTYDFDSTMVRIDYLKYCFNRFDQVSFREKTGVELAREVFDIDSDFVLDPVFLLTIEDWKKIERKSARVEEPFGIVFFYEDNGYQLQTDAFVEKLEKKYNCHMILVMRSESEKENAISNVKIEELLWLIDHAQCILTNSFHVTALSIIFQKEFFTVNRTRQLPTRITNIIQLFGLSERMITDYRYDEVELDDIFTLDYTPVIKIENSYIKYSEEWLKKALVEASNKKRRGWNENDYLRRRVDELTITVSKLIERVNALSTDDERLMPEDMFDNSTISREEIVFRFNGVADDDLINYLKRKHYTNLAIYGVGIVGKAVIQRIEKFQDIHINYLVDRKVKEYKGYEVFSEPVDSSVDCIIVTVLGQNESIKRYIKSFYREIDVLMIEDWLNEFN